MAFPGINFNVGLLILAALCGSVFADCECSTTNLREFGSEYTDNIRARCRKCLTYSYDYDVEQNWTTRVCVSAIPPVITPLHVNFRHALGGVSFTVPLVIKGENVQYSRVCRTLCPLAHHGNTSFLDGTRQSIIVDFWSASNITFKHEVTVLNNFIIETNQEITLNLTVSEPAVLKHVLSTEYTSVRVEADSNTTECMLFSVEDIECPFHDTHDTVQQEGYWLTQTKQSSMTIRREEFQSDLYVVLLLQPTDDCRNSDEEIEHQGRFKEVTVRISPVIEPTSYVIWMPIVVFFFVGLFWCCMYFWWCVDNDIEVESTVEQYCSKDYYVLRDMEENKPWSSKSYYYSWYLAVIFVFYSLPAIQFVYTSQHYMRTTGSMDLCYYNFKCAHQVELFWGIIISDSAHVFSNIGYIILGVLFLFIVLLRERFDPDSPMNIKERRSIAMDNLPVHRKNLMTSDPESEETTGIPRHYGLFYALGLALIMEGIMSGIYHICPKKTNFQFDTTFMYVICTLCIIKMYYGRHVAISPKAHTFWLMVATSVFLPFIGTLNETVFWVLFSCWVCWIVMVVIFYVILPTRIDFGCGNEKPFSPMVNICGVLKVHLLSPKKKYRDTCFRSIVLAIILAVIIVILICSRIFLTDDPNTILLYFYISSLIGYSAYYGIMKFRLCCCNSLNTPKAMTETINCPAAFYFTLSSILMVVAVAAFFIKNNTEWTETPAVSREKNKPCYLDLNYYDVHDTWHFLSAFGLFFFFMFLLNVDNDLRKRPAFNIFVF